MDDDGHAVAFELAQETREDLVEALEVVTAGSLLALRWVAHLPGAVGSGLAEFARARDLDEGLVQRQLAEAGGCPRLVLQSLRIPNCGPVRMLGPLAKTLPHRW